MKIAVFGWYGHDNAGDERIKYCLNHFLKGLGGIDTVNFYDLHNHAIKGKTSEFDHYDLVVIGGGGLIVSKNNYHDFIMGLNTRILTAGISVETNLKGNPLKFSQALLHKSCAVLVRDQASYDKLKPYDANRVLEKSCDLTFLEPYSVIDTSESSKVGINLQSKIKPGFINNNYLSRRFSYRFPCIGPKIYSFEQDICFLEGRMDLVPIPLYFESKPEGCPAYMQNDHQFMMSYFQDVPVVFNDEYMDKCRLFISMRLHGLIFALQKGIPFLGFDIYPKQINLAKEAGVDVSIIHLKSGDSIYEKIKKTEDEYVTLKEKILTYRELSCDKIKKDLINILN